MVHVVSLLLQKRRELSKALLGDQYHLQGEARDPPMWTLMLDNDERIRREAVEAMLELCLQNHEAVPTSFLRHVSDRALDKRLAVRQQAIEGLSKLYQKYCAPFEMQSLNSSMQEKFGWISTRIVTLLRGADQELRSFITRCLEDICMDVDPKIRSPSQVSMDLYCSIRDKGKEEFVTILKGKFRLQVTFAPLSHADRHTISPDGLVYAVPLKVTHS